jgi:hypothetical protein
MSLTAGAATALEFEPWALAEEQERKSLVVDPDPAVELIDPRFEKYRVGNAVVERLYTGMRWAEGLVWFADGRYLLFSDIPNNRMRAMAGRDWSSHPRRITSGLPVIRDESTWLCLPSANPHRVKSRTGHGICRPRKCIFNFI